MIALFREALRYAAASACALLVDFVVLWALVRYLHCPYLAAATLSFSGGMVIAYVLSIKLVFTQRRLIDRRTEFFSFAAIGVAGLAINAAAMLIAVKYLGFYYLVAKCMAAGFTFSFNFLARRQLLFIRKPRAPGIAQYVAQR